VPWLYGKAIKSKKQKFPKNNQSEMKNLKEENSTEKRKLKKIKK